jgi:CheY-like chemotaxis protein
VDATADGLDALRLAAAAADDLVIADRRMPAGAEAFVDE